MKMHPILKEYYGDSPRWFIGEVIDGSPPSGLEGMVRVRIRGIHSGNVNDVPQNDLPWATVLIPGTEPGVSGLGLSPQIMPGAQVFGIFMDGSNSQVPLIIGTIPRIELPSSVQASGRDDIATNPFSYDLQRQRIEFVRPEQEPDKVGSDTQQSEQRRSICCKFFIDNGYTLPQAAGITGVIQSVSNFDPLSSNGSNGLGICHWNTTGSRYRNLLNFTSRLGRDIFWYNFEVQLLFILHELSTTQRQAGAKLLRTNLIVDDKYPNSIHGNGSAALFIKNYLPKEIQPDVSLSISESNAKLIQDIILA